MNVKFPNAEFNAAMRDGNAGQKITRILDEIKPESVYFTEQEGQRSVILIVNLNDPSNVPTLAEPWFLAFNASVEYKIVMTPEDLKNAGLDEIAKKWA
jgi:hypothetical protein